MWSEIDQALRSLELTHPQPNFLRPFLAMSGIEPPPLIKGFFQLFILEGDIHILAYLL